MSVRKNPGKLFSPRRALEDFVTTTEMLIWLLRSVVPRDPDAAGRVRAARRRVAAAEREGRRAADTTRQVHQEW